MSVRAPEAAAGRPGATRACAPSRALAAALLLPLAAACAPPASGPLRPARGLILISLDTLRADHLGCYGYERETSPFLDRLAGRGTLFLRHVAQVPSTLPSHMSMLTGLYPGELGMSGFTSELSPRIPLLAEVLHDAGFRTAGFTEGGWMMGSFGFARGFDEWRDPAYSADTDVGLTLDRGLAFLRSLEPDDRYFLFLHTYSIHDPYRPPDEYRARFWPGAPPPGAPEPTGPNLERINAGELSLPDAALDYHRALYDASIRYVDSELERFFAALERLGLADDTLVVVTSDHGEEFREHGRVAHTQVYWESLHVPLLVLHPTAGAGTRVAALTRGVDLAPTLLELVGVPAPPVSGRSLVPLLRDAQAPFDEPAYSEVDADWRNERSLIVAADGRLDQLVRFSPPPDGRAWWVSREIRFDAFSPRLEFRAVTLVEPREVEVRADGEKVATFEVTPEWRDYRIELGGAAEAKRVVTLRCASCVVPAEAGLGDDRRCLSFKIRGFPLDRVELYDLARDPAGATDLSTRDPARTRDLESRLDGIRHVAVHPPGRPRLPADRLEELRALGYL